MYFIDMDGVIARHVKKDYVGKTPNFLDKNYFGKLKLDSRFSNFLKSEIKRVGDQNNFVFLSKVPKIGTYNDLEDGDTTDYASLEKRKWLDEHGFKNCKLITVPYDESKVDYAESFLGHPLTASDVLIDDYNPNLLEWLDRGGKALKYYNGKNSPETAPERSGVLYCHKN